MLIKLDFVVILTCHR